MSTLTPRNIEILKIIVDEYLETGTVLGSKLLLKKYDLGVSSATVRNDMAHLEKLELVYQPYNSAGRLPTTKGLRAFVNYLMRETPEHFLQEKNVSVSAGDFRRINDYVHKIVYELSKNTGEIAFFTIPEKHIVEYAGVPNFLKKNHKKLGDEIYSLLEMLEDKMSFMKFISDFPLGNGVNVLIGEENILPYLKDYSLIIKPLHIDGETAYLGILWGLQMDYSFNIAAVRGMI